jgi:hypothetical protein
MTTPPPITVSLDKMLLIARQLLIETGGRGRRWSEVRDSLIKMLVYQRAVRDLERRAR